MSRQSLLDRLASQPDWDVIVIGGGATGLGVALDAAARRYSVALVEANDFAKGTSSRTTKLVHGGVRYLAQGNVALVREALRERAALLANAPHLAQPLPFVMPAYRWWEKAFYGAGLVLYDLLAGRAGLGKTQFLSRDKTLGLSPTARQTGLRGGVKYWDGQFDDARLAIALARTANERGACVVNYCKAVELLRGAGQVSGVVVEDAETSRRFELRSRCVINATGVWVDHIREMDSPGGAQMVAPSQGVHLVVDREFLPTDHALLLPDTADGRVLFAIPWLGKTLLGTTDTPRQDLVYEPRAFEQEIDFILRESARYLSKAPTRKDVRSIWVGLRPLVRPVESHGGKTKAISREHTVVISKSGLVTVTGGKWTTYRAMAEDVLEECFARKFLPRRDPGATTHLRLAPSCLFQRRPAFISMGPTRRRLAPCPAPPANLHLVSPKPWSALPCVTNSPAPLKTSSPAGRGCCSLTQRWLPRLRQTSRQFSRKSWEKVLTRRDQYGSSRGLRSSMSCRRTERRDKR